MKTIEIHSDNQLLDFSSAKSLAEETAARQKENGQWYYLDGVQKKPVLPGRNDPCWCGSGKKSKKCHGVVG